MKNLTQKIAQEARQICAQIYADYYSTIYPEATEDMIEFAVSIKLQETGADWKKQMASLAIMEGIA